MKPITKTKPAPKHDAHCYDFARFRVEGRGDDWNTFLASIGGRATDYRLRHKAPESQIAESIERLFFGWALV